MEQKLLFTNKQLRNMILPLVMEQFLLMLVLLGLSDTFIVSQCMGAGDTEQAEQSCSGYGSGEESGKHFT